MKTTYEYRLPEDMKAAIDDFGCFENIETFFGFEFSCGDGLFLSDLDWDRLVRYDGLVDSDLIRLDNGKLIKAPYRIRYVYDDFTRENSKAQVIR